MIKSISKISYALLFAQMLQACQGDVLFRTKPCEDGMVREGNACVSATKAGVGDCKDPDLNNLKQGDAITMCDGSIGKGRLSNCNGVGQTNCVVTTPIPSCTTDGQTGCITTSTLKAADTSTISAYDLRFGKTLAGIAGQRKTCRNGMNTSTSPALCNYDGNTSAIGTGAQTGGTNGDWWDTIDDYNFGLGIATFGPIMGSTPAWSSDYYCDGSQITEVTNNASYLVPSGVKINCDATTCGPSAQNFTFTQVFQDGYTGLYITNVLATTTSTVNWAEAIDACNNIQSGDGTGRWRLPTQKELMELYTGGISLQDSAKFFGRLNDTFWSASSFSVGTTLAWYVSIAVAGYTNFGGKTGNSAVLCVR